MMQGSGGAGEYPAAAQEGGEVEGSGVLFIQPGSGLEHGGGRPVLPSPRASCVDSGWMCWCWTSRLSAPPTDYDVQSRNGSQAELWWCLFMQPLCSESEAEQGNQIIREAMGKEIIREPNRSVTFEQHAITGCIQVYSFYWRVAAILYELIKRNTEL